MNVTHGVLFLLFAFLLTSCSTSYTLRIVDEQAQEIYLEFTGGDDVKVSDVFALYHYHQSQSTGGHQGHGSGQRSLKQLVGYVQVTRFVNESLAEVKILSGKVQGGVTVEKIKQ